MTQLTEPPMLSSLRLFQLISPSLPVGSYAYSQGMEWAVEQGWVQSARDLQDWLGTLLNDGLATLDLPVLLRAYQSCQLSDRAALDQWGRLLLAHRETRELRQEELNRARAMRTVLKGLLDPCGQERLTQWYETLGQSQLAVLAFAACHWGIADRDVMAGFSWSWLENSVAAAIKLVPLGQSEGQSVLYELARSVPDIVDQAFQIHDDEIGSSNFALAIASSRHESQYTRLFRS